MNLIEIYYLGLHHGYHKLKTLEYVVLNQQKIYVLTKYTLVLTLFLNVKYHQPPQYHYLTLKDDFVFD